MSYFTGTYLHTLDERGRIALPAKLREKLGEKVAVTYGRTEQSLAVYPYAVWEVTVKKVLEQPVVNDSENDMRLFFFGNAWEGAADGQGRIPLPDHMREATGLSGEVAVVGAGDHVQIWDKEAWISKRADLRKRPPSLTGPRPSDRAAEQ
jgi:MraZ protein